MTSPHILDLTDSAELDAGVRGGYHKDGVREVLAALQLRPVSGPMVDLPRGDVFDLAVYRATGDHHLASIFGSVA